MSSTYNIVLSSSESTVVTEYTSEQKRSDAYQSETALEKEFIRMLEEQGYEYLKIHTPASMEQNLRRQLERLNEYTFTQKEWDEFFKNQLANSNEGIVDKTRTIQEDSVKNLIRENGATQNISLIDKKNIHNNYLQVINQYVADEGTHDNRYDVTILVNGLPLVHVELKRRGIPLTEAFNQIDRYQRESFWSGSGLYEYVQIFVISNGTHTKYYSNTTRDSAIEEQKRNTRKKSKKTSNSFKFTSFWADGNNKIISDLVDFTKTFFAKHTILNILTKYCIFTSEQMLLVMRPYQIVATERIINRIEVANNYKKMGSVSGGGYIWHTTGSGKTLTSFKAARLAATLPYIEKVIFVVDRKDLDYQTMKEYDRFEKGAANGNKSTKILQRQLENRDEKGNFHEYKIIVTTIQKLGEFVKRNKSHPVYHQHLVMIFDECHRSQFGELHSQIVKNFKNYHIFGFTGTPIFADNAKSGGNPELKTTEQAFGDKLHTYTIVDAINDENVLPFRIDFVDTLKLRDIVTDKPVEAINSKEVLESSQRVLEIVDYIIDHFDQKTQRNAYYSLQGQRLNGFNSIFAVSSIDMAKKYYLTFKKRMEDKSKHLTVATIFSFGANEEEGATGILSEEDFDTEGLDVTAREFLDSAIADYNKIFKTNFDSSAKGFQDYYKDLSDRVKKREVDLLIVVNMFLTGFDATTLNTLWVDKNLRQHGLIQAFSRTNRILNTVKAYGNIVCFRDLQQETNEAIALFGDKNAAGTVLLKSYEDYYYGCDDNGKHQKGYEERIAELLQKYPLEVEIPGEQKKKDFVVLFGNILRLRNILSAFDRFEGNEILSPRDFQDYTGIYTDIYEELRTRKPDEESIIHDVVFEMELVKQVEVNIDYILMLVAKYHDSHCKDKEILVSIEKAIKSSLELRSKKELIEQFLERVNVNTNVESDWKEFVRKQKDIDLNKIISTCRLKPEETRTFIANSFRDGILRTTGTDFDQILPPVSRFGGGREKIKNEVLEELKKYFDKYFGLVTPDMTFGVQQYQVSENAGYVMVAESQMPLDIS